jgi:hypothetical protein
MREKFLEYLSKVDRNMPANRREQLVHFAETRLTEFLRELFDPDYPGLYARTNRNFYVDAEDKMQHNPEMRQITEADSLYGLSIMHYKNFLASKQFRGKDKPTLSPEERKVKENVSSSKKGKKQSDPLLPESEEPTIEGKSRQVNITVYERNPEDRKKALKRDNYECQVCHMNFEAVYGEIGKEYIEVHHLYPVSNMGEVYHFDALDPERGLVCLCSNCHSMIHRGGRFEEREGKRVMIPMTLEDLQNLFAKLNLNN